MMNDKCCMFECGSEMNDKCCMSECDELICVVCLSVVV